MVSKALDSCGDESHFADFVGLTEFAALCGCILYFGQKVSEMSSASEGRLEGRNEGKDQPRHVAKTLDL